MIRALIVDDEPLARDAIRRRLEGEADVIVAGEAEDGPQALAAIRALRPDVVFLDVQMPGLDGFQVLAGLAGEPLPRVVFVTAHDAHALRAFEIHALDYLLKPLSEKRFQECLRRARHELARSDPADAARVADLLQELAAARAGLTEASPAPRPRRFAVREKDRIVLVPAENLQAVEAAGNYVMLVEGARKHLLRLTLAEMEGQLDPLRFTRIHRSTIVNVDRVREIHPDPHGDCDVVLDNGAVYRMSRVYRERLLPGGRAGA